MFAFVFALAVGGWSALCFWALSFAFRVFRAGRHATDVVATIDAHPEDYRPRHLRGLAPA